MAIVPRPSFWTPAIEVSVGKIDLKWRGVQNLVFSPSTILRLLQIIFNMILHMNSRAFVLFAFLFCISQASAQPGILWSHSYGGNVTDWCNAVQPTADGGYILAGHTQSFGAVHDDLWAVKTGADGDSLWSCVIRGSEIDECKSVLQTADGGYLLIGSTYSVGAGSSDFWAVKISAEGDSLWSRTFGGSLTETCNSAVLAADGSILLAGRAASFGNGGGDFWLVKMSADGDSLWSRHYGGNSYDECMSVQQTADGGYILAGWTSSFGAGSYDFWLVKTDADGDSLWSRAFGGSNIELCYSVQQTTDGGYILGGRTESFGAANQNMWLVKTDANGNSLWSRAFGGSGYERCYSVLEAPGGGYVLAGETSSYGGSDYDYWLVRTDADGDSLWSCTYGGGDTQSCSSIQKAHDYGYVLAGNDFGTTFGDFWLVKTEPDPTPAPPQLFTRLAPVDSSMISVPDTVQFARESKSPMCCMWNRQIRILFQSIPFWRIPRFLS
jgi:hypothetical protein